MANKRKTILVPLDGSQFAECALPMALSIARRLNGQIGLISVSSKKRGRSKKNVTTISPTDVNMVDEVASDYLGGVAARIADSSSVPVYTMVLTGRTAAALVKHAKAHHPDLIVMSTHGRGPLSHHWLGSVADAVVRRIPTPVLLVRPETDCKPKLDDKLQCRHIVVPLDGSSLSEQSLAWAKALGERETEYSLVQATPCSITAWSHQPDAKATGTADLAAAAHADAAAYLGNVKRTLEKSGLTVKMIVEDTKPPAVGILDATKRVSADLIVISTHGHGGLRRLVLGGVVDKVIRASHVPVLAVKPVAA